MFKKSTGLFIVIALLIVLKCAYAEPDAVETIKYNISPIGHSEYQDFGMVNFLGKKLKLVTFWTDVLGFCDLEKIYIDPKTLLPVFVERDLKIWMDKEYLTEDYDQKNFNLAITKFKNKKKVDEYLYDADGPIHNAVFMPFYVRTVREFKPGWSLEARFPGKFKVQLAGIEEVEVPAGKFKAYHFTSEPNKFEIWITADKARIPVKIKGCGGLNYTLEMSEYFPNGKNHK